MKTCFLLILYSFVSYFVGCEELSENQNGKKHLILDFFLDSSNTLLKFVNLTTVHIISKKCFKASLTGRNYEWTQLRTK